MSMEENVLIQEAQQGDLDSFNHLVLNYQGIVFNQAYRMLGNIAIAEDITQEAFISAFKNIRLFRGGSFKAWLLRIVTNGCYDELRRQKRHPLISLEPSKRENELDLDTPHWMQDPVESPEDRALRRELQSAIQNCLNNLSVDFRAIVILVDIQGLDYQEASKAVGKPVGTIKSRLCRARLKLRECLQGFWELLPARFRLVKESIP